MASRVHLLFPSIPLHPTKSRTHPFPSMTHLKNRAKPQTISCTKSTNDSDLLAIEVEKINTHLVQREEAMKKSRNLLFAELCKYLGLSPEELKMKLGEMEEDDKWVLVREFISEWGVDFHPLSARSVKEMVEQHLVEENPVPLPPPPPPPPSQSSPSVLFPGLKKMIGFPPGE